MNLNPFSGFFVGIGVFFACLGSNFIIQDARLAKIQGGRQEAGVMMDYRIDVNTCNSSDKLEFQYLYANGEALELSLLDRYGSRLGKFEKKSKITLKATGRIKKGEKRSLPEALDIPADMRSKTLLIFSANGRRKIRELENLTKQETIYAP